MDSNSPDLARIKGNVSKMVSMGAPESDIDAYITGEGTSVEAIKAFKSAAPEQYTNKGFRDAVDSNPVTKAFVGLGGGLVKAGVGAIQGVSQLVGADNIAQAAGRATQEINQNEQPLGTAGKIGDTAGQVAPYIAMPANAATLGGRMALGAAGGAVQGALNAQETPDLKQRAIGAAEMAALGVAAPVVGKLVGDTIKGGSKVIQNVAKGAANPEATQTAMQAAKDAANSPRTADAFKDLARQSYQKAADAGGVLKPELAQKFIDAAESIAPKSAWAKAADTTDPIGALAENLQVMKGKPMSLADAQELDSMLGEAAYKNVDVKGQMNAVGKKYLDLQSSLRDMIGSANPNDVIGGKAGFDSLNEARGYWSKAMQLGDIERLATRAELSDKPYTILKTGLRQIASNPKKMKMLPPEVQDAIREGAKGGKTVDELRMASSRLLRMVGAATHGPAGYVIGSLANSAADSALSKMVANRLDNIAGTIANGAKAQAPSMAERIGATVGDKTRTIVNAISGQSGSVEGVGPKTLAGGALAGGLGAANFASSLETNTQNDPATPTPIPNGDMPLKGQKEVSVNQPEASNVSNTFVDKLVNAESSGRNNARNTNSSAFGPTQYVKSSWLQDIQKYAPEYTVGKNQRDILNLRSNPEVARQVTAGRAEDNAKSLTSDGIPVNDTTLYLAHFLGTAGAKALLTAKIGTPVQAIPMLRKAIKANPSVLKGKRAEQVLQWAKEKMV